MRMPIDWDAERFDAHEILSSFVADLHERGEAQNGLLRRWPERPNQVCSNYSASCIPEIDMRQAEHSPFPLLQKLIQGSLYALLRASFGGKGVDLKQYENNHIETVLRICSLSDKEVAEAVPFLLPKLQRKALLSISSLLSDKTRSASRNRSYLEKKVEQDLLQGSFEAELIRGKLQDGTSTARKVLQILKCPNSYKTEAEVSKGRISMLGPKRSPKTAAIEALMHLDNLPLVSLHVMLEILRGKAPNAMIGKLPNGANKSRLINSITDIGMELLSDMKDDEPLPEHLRKALVVMSLSARHASGDDGKLLEHLGGPHPQKIRTRQRRLIYSLSRLKLLSKDTVAMLFQDLVKSSNLSVGQQQPDALRKILLDCLLRSEVRRIPKVVRRTLKKIKRIVRQDPKTKAKEEESNKVDEKFVRNEEKYSSQFQEVRMGVELEATLRVSAHLQQIVQDSLPETPQPPTNWRKGSKEASRKKNGSKLSEEKIVNACDKTAGVGYTLVGFALQGMIRFSTINVNSKHSVANYLHSGTETDVKSKVSESAAFLGCEQDQVTLILRAAESLLGASVLSRVKIRLGKV